MVTHLVAGDWIELANGKKAVIGRLVSGGRSMMVRIDGESAQTMVGLGEVAFKLSRLGQKIPVNAVQLVADRSRVPLTEVVVTEVRKTVCTYDRHEARKIVEAMRCGVVPLGHTEFYTVGRDKELSLVDIDLESAQESGAMRVFLGEYGTGKTHMLDSVEREALAKNFLVARAVLDSGETCPSQPRRVYSALTKGLVYPDAAGASGLEPLLRKYCFPEESGKQNPPAKVTAFPTHKYLTPALEYYRWLSQHSNDKEIAAECGDFLGRLLDWLEGRPSGKNTVLDDELRRFTRLRNNRLYALMDCRTWAHLYAYMLGGISVLARCVGYSGLVVLLDEAELYSVLSSSGRDFADLLFGYYAAAALGRRQVKFNALEAPRGGHKVHRDMPPIFTENQGIYCAIAMTPDPEGLAALKRIVDEPYFSELAPLTVEDHMQLCRKVLEIYHTVYPEWSFGEDSWKPLGVIVHRASVEHKFDSPRQLLRLVVEVLDYGRLCPKDIMGYVNELREHLETPSNTEFDDPYDRE